MHLSNGARTSPGLPGFPWQPLGNGAAGERGTKQNAGPCMILCTKGKDPMRHLFLSLAALGMLLGLSGCCCCVCSHVAGRCDCCPDCHCCHSVDDNGNCGGSHGGLVPRHLPAGQNGQNQTNAD